MATADGKASVASQTEQEERTNEICEIAIDELSATVLPRLKRPADLRCRADQLRLRFLR